MHVDELEKISKKIHSCNDTKLKYPTLGLTSTIGFKLGWQKCQNCETNKIENEEQTKKQVEKIRLLKNEIKQLKQELYIKEDTIGLLSNQINSNINYNNDTNVDQILQAKDMMISDMKETNIQNENKICKLMEENYENKKKISEMMDLHSSVMNYQTENHKEKKSNMFYWIHQQSKIIETFVKSNNMTDNTPINKITKPNFGNLSSRRDQAVSCPNKNEKNRINRKKANNRSQSNNMKSFAQTARFNNDLPFDQSEKLNLKKNSEMIKDISSKQKTEKEPGTIKSRLRLCLDRNNSVSDCSLAFAVQKNANNDKSFFNKGIRMGKENCNYAQNVNISPRYSKNFVKNGKNCQTRDVTPKCRTPRDLKKSHQNIVESDFDPSNTKIKKEKNEVVKSLFNPNKPHSIFQDIRKFGHNAMSSNKNHTISKNSFDDYFSNKNHSNLAKNYFSIDVSDSINFNTEQDSESVNKYNTNNTTRKFKESMFKEGDQNLDFYNNFFDKNSLYHPNFYKNMLCIKPKKKQNYISSLN